MAELKGPDKQRYVSEMFARISGRYDLMNTLMTGGLHLRWKEKTARLTTGGLTGKALDVATGTGDLAFSLARCPGIDGAVGVDVLPQMVSLAREKGRSKDPAQKVTFVLGDAHALPFPNDSFACATAGFSLRNMSNLDQALSEMVRVVRPGGRVSTLELTPMRPGGLSALMRIYTQGLVPILGRLIARDRAAYTYLPQSVDHFIDAGTLAGRFQDLGLTGVSYRRLGFGAVTLHWGDKPKMELGSTAPATG